MSLRAAVYVNTPIPYVSQLPGVSSGLWSPTTNTLIYSDKEAVLVDTPITIQQTEELVRWIKKIAPGRKLSYIYITHGHGDHFFGIPILLKHFPEAVPVATPGTVKHMESEVETQAFEKSWNARFPGGQIYQPFTLAKPLSKESAFKFKIDNQWVFQAVECGHSDTYDSTVLWVPDLKLAVCGDVVYGQVHQMLLEANNATKREEWVKAVETVEALNPSYVVPGHRQAEEVDGVWHLAATKKYVQDFGRVVESDPTDAKAIVTGMLELYPDRHNENVLFLGALAAVAYNKAKQSSG